MNERVLSPQLLKLVKAAGPGYSQADPAWVKTFAELIVKEFSEQVQLAGRFGLEQEQILIRICCKKAKQHFGVEE